MGNYLFKEPEPSPPMVLVPPLFEFPPLATRARMAESSYSSLFGNHALKCLFEDYFEEASHISSRVLLRPIDDPNVDLVATVSVPFDHELDENVVGKALFRWQRDVDDPHTFVDIFISNSNPILRLRTCAYYPEYGCGTFCIFPFLVKNRLPSNDGVVGLRYGSETLSIGATLKPFFYEYPKCVWLVSKMGKLTAGLQYEPLYVGQESARLQNLRNWSYAIGYGLGSGSPLSPCFNFCLKLARNSQFICSFYQHFVVQRRVQNPFEEEEVVGITNYIDIGFELQTRIKDDAKSATSIADSTFQIAASWQANKNFLLKGIVGPLRSSVALAFKSWWNPAFTFNISANRDRRDGKTAFGFGVRVENLREARYERADRNYVMLTPNKEHLAESLVWKVGQRPMMESQINCGNFDAVPTELRPIGKIL